MCECPWRPDGVRLVETVVTGGCESPDVDAEDRIHTLIRTENALSHLSLSHLPAPKFKVLKMCCLVGWSLAICGHLSCSPGLKALAALAEDLGSVPCIHVTAHN